MDDDARAVLAIAAALFLAAGGWLFRYRRNLEAGDYGLVAVLFLLGAAAVAYALALGR